MYGGGIADSFDNRMVENLHAFAALSDDGDIGS